MEMSPSASVPAPSVARRPPQWLARWLAPLAQGGTWLVGAGLGLFFALLLRDSTHVDGAYLPRSNDSLYHARRILDASSGGSGLYQFDPRLHAPEGAWISWPWGYDWLMAQGARAFAWLAPGVDPMAFLAYFPSAWVLVNAALLLAVATALGLSPGMRLLVMICFGLSPLTQLLHAAGMVDHHYVEHTFVLLNVWLGMRWLREPANPARAAWLGVALGVAPGFHNGLFILQLVVLATVLALWLRDAAPPRRAVLGFAGALLVATQLVLLPSEPYQLGMFEFGLLSWFHFYVATCTAVTLAWMAWRPFSRARLAGLAGLALLLAAPLGAQFVSGAGFVSGRFSILEEIVEANSPWELYTRTFGPTATLSWYSWLLFAAPLMLAGCVVQAFRERAPDRLYFLVAASFGLALLLAQFRLQYFGFFALVMVLPWALDALAGARRWNRGAVFAMALALVAVAYQPAMRQRLFLWYPPGGDAAYAESLPLLRTLGRECRREPGVVLAHSDVGSPILFHSDCSVISNNFILRADDARYLAQIPQLFALSPEELRRQRPDIRYVLVRDEPFGPTPTGVRPAAPPGWTLIDAVYYAKGDGGTGVGQRLYKAVAPQR